MRTLVVLVAGLCALSALAYRPKNSDRLGDAIDAKPFRSGKEYTFSYNTQMATGLSPKTSEQKAATRLEAKVKLAFRSDDKAILRLEDVRFGQRNEEMYQPEQMQPMRAFEEKTISSEQQEQLRLPAQITIEDGIVKRIQFSERDSAWSKNIKRGVVNLVQLNLKRQNAVEDESREESEINSCDNDKTSCTFTLKEINLEGKCKTTYVLNKAGQKQSSDEATRFNVTKSIDFQHCTEVADVAYGFQQQEIQPECTYQNDADEDEKKNGKLPQGPICDPKEVKQQKIDRSSVFRYTLSGQPTEYGIERAEVLSQYVIKNMNAEQHQAAHHVTVLSELVYEDDAPASSKATSDSGISNKAESLLYNAEREVEEKRFFMHGDEEFGRQSPFEQVPNKAGLAKKIVANMLASWTHNIDTEATLHFGRLVDVLRMSSVSELHKIWTMLVEGNNGMDLKSGQQERLEQVLQDALAIAGTRNTVKVLVEKIINEKIPVGKAVHALKMLTSVPAPSTKIAKEIEHLCKHDVSDNSGPLKQSCWLTYGSLVADLCREKPVKVQMPEQLRNEQQCPRDVKDQFKNTLVQLYKSADSTYEKILALKAIGNAALDIAVHDLEEIYKNQRQEPAVRMQAIDSLRRLRTQMPHKIHRSLMPIFENVREQPEVRMAAFAMIMHTVPEKSVIDQITYVLMRESSENVKSFVYTTAQALVKSTIPSEQELGQHLENALKFAKMETTNLRASRQYHVPVYCQKEKEGFFLGMSSMFSTRNALPAHIAARIDGLFNSQLKRNAMEMHLSQKDVERWYEKALELIGEGSMRPTRGQRSQRRGAEHLRNMYNEYGYKSRRSDYDNERDSEPFGMLTIRILDIDQVILPVAEQQLPRVLKNALQGEKPKISELLRLVPEEAKHFRMSAAMLFAEKQAMIPTSNGFPLRFRQSLPVLTAVQGSIQLQLNGQRPKVQLSMQTVATPVYEQKVEVWSPIAAAGIIRRESVELNLPLDFTGQADKEQAKITVKLPQEKHTLVVLRTVPALYTDETSEKSEPEREPKLNTVHSPRVEHLYREIYQPVGKAIDIPVVVKGHYHIPAKADFRGIVDAWKATQNTIRVEYEPTSETPEKLEIQATWSLFEKARNGQLELNDFYRETKFDSIYSSEETDSMELDSQSERNRKLNSYINSYKPNGMYKHNIKISAKTIAGRRQNEASVELKGECEPRMTYCNVNLKAETNRDWQMNAELQALLPETVKDISELERLSEKQKHFVVKMRADWNRPQKQEVRVNIQGEPAMTRQQRKVEQELSRHYPQFKALTAFVNKYDVEATYKLMPGAQSIVNKAYEALKAAYFWQSSTELKDGTDGTVHISAIIDPITRRHANVTVKTPTQRLRISTMDLPANTRPLPFVRRQPLPKHGLTSILSSFSNGLRAECRINNDKIRTFDDVVFRAGLPKCYAALAKDCSSDEPRFAVYMKRISENGQQKKLKVVTEEQIVEVKPKGDGLFIELNGQRVDEDWESQARYGIYTDSEKQEVVIDMSGVQVHFDGEEATISVSPLYKNGVCGLCGHYDDESEDELRMHNNELTSDLKEFHRSYVHQTEGECTKQEFDTFYAKQKFQSVRRSQEKWDSDEWEDDEFFGNGRQYQTKKVQKKWRKQNEDDSQEKPEPIEMTETQEYHEKLCFSMKPAKKCPKGTEPDSTSEKTVPFKCYQRGSIDAQRMLKKARNGEVLDFSDEEPSFSHSVKAARSCVEAY